MVDYAEKIESKNRYSFNIGYQGTEENSDTHKRFQRFSQAYDGVYISALRVLLDEWDKRQEYDCILELMDELEKRIGVLEAELEGLKSPVVEKRSRVPKSFGKKDEMVI